MGRGATSPRPFQFHKGAEMKKLTYNIADIPISVELPFEMHISAESAPFLKDGETEMGERIRVTAVDALPPVPANGIWHQDRCFLGESFHIRSGPGKAPYALVEYGEAGNVRISYLRDSGEMIPESRYLMNMLCLESLLLRHGGLILHAAFIRWQGQGILFSAPSGTGKSTQAQLWEQYMGAEILNGDRAAIRNRNGIWTAYGLPYAGTSHIYRNTSAPIRAIVILRQAPQNRIRPLPVSEALRALLPEFTAHRWDPSFMEKMLDMLSQLLQHVPAYCLECRPDRSAVQLLKRSLYDLDPG
jgi:hypothetical protein